MEHEGKSFGEFEDNQRNKKRKVGELFLGVLQVHKMKDRSS